MSRSLMSRVVTVLGLAALSLSPVTPAHAAGSVGVDNGGNGAVIDATYSSTLSVGGRGFQSIKGGHGGVYVWFGTVKGTWQPSRGGTSGVNYLYVPDSESKGNKGFQRFVAFPGSDTAGSANGGTMSADGSWQVDLVVPGPVFEAVGRNGSVQTVDCRKVTCGVITVGAHGVHNANNETFTPVRVADLQSAGSASPSASPSSPASTSGGQAAGTTTGATQGEPDPGSSSGQGRESGQGTAKGDTSASGDRPRLKVDRPSAIAGRGMSFLATGLTPGSQVTLVLDDGVVASGPFLVGQDGGVAGVMELPVDLRAGTHELRTFGAGRAASVSFGVPQAEPVSETVEPEDQQSSLALGFAVAAGLVFLAALVIALRRLLGGRRAQA